MYRLFIFLRIQVKNDHMKLGKWLGKYSHPRERCKFGAPAPESSRFCGGGFCCHCLYAIARCSRRRCLGWDELINFSSKAITTNCPWKLMVGRWNFLFKWPLFPGTCSIFWGGNLYFPLLLCVWNSHWFCCTRFPGWRSWRNSLASTIHIFIFKLNAFVKAWSVPPNFKLVT